MASLPLKARFLNGQSLAKSAWRVFKLDKELAVIALIQSLVGLAVLVAAGLLYLFVVASAQGADVFSVNWVFDTESADWQLPAWQNLLFLFGLYMSMTAVANFFSGAVIHGALERFRGGDPTVRSSLGAAFRKWQPLILFSLMMATIGLALDMLQDKVPFIGKIAIALVNMGWNIANLFSVPAIMASKENLHPFDATRESAKVIKKVWGEGVAANISLVAAFLFVLMTILLGGLAVTTVVGMSAQALGLTPLVLVPFGILVSGAFIASVLVFMVLGSIVKAALYHYAITGKTPQQFNEQLLRSAITPRKARKIFS